MTQPSPNNHNNELNHFGVGAEPLHALKVGMALVRESTRRLIGSMVTVVDPRSPYRGWVGQVEGVMASEGICYLTILGADGNISLDGSPNKNAKPRLRLFQTPLTSVALEPGHPGNEDRWHVFAPSLMRQ